MINFVPDFVSCKAGNNKNGLPEPVPEGAMMEKVVEHIRHVGQLIGRDYVDISADFVGIPSMPEGILLLCVYIQRPNSPFTVSIHLAVALHIIFSIPPHL